MFFKFCHFLLLFFRFSLYKLEKNLYNSHCKGIGLCLIYEINVA